MSRAGGTEWVESGQPWPAQESLLFSTCVGLGNRLPHCPVPSAGGREEGEHRFHQPGQPQEYRESSLAILGVTESFCNCFNFWICVLANC